MNQTTPIHGATRIHIPGGLITRLAIKISYRRRQATDLVHAAGDARAREHGWTVTTSPGPFGLHSRVYRDPRFATRQPAVPAVEAPERGWSR